MPKRSRQDEIDELSYMLQKKTRLDLRRNPVRSSRRVVDEKRKQLEVEKEMKKIKRVKAKQLQEEANEMFEGFSNMSIRRKRSGRSKRSKRSGRSGRVGAKREKG